MTIEHEYEYRVEVAGRTENAYKNGVELDCAISEALKAGFSAMEIRIVFARA